MVKLGEAFTLKGSNDPYQAGIIVYYENFKFHNGVIKSKYFLILGRNGDELLLLMITSQQKTRKNIPGCHQNYFHDREHSTGKARVDGQWILFAQENQNKDTVNDIKSKTKSSKTIIMDKRTFGDIVNCFKNSNHFIKKIHSQYIPSYN